MKIIVKTNIKKSIGNSAITTIIIGGKIYTIEGYLDMLYDCCISQCMYQYRLKIYAEIFKVLFGIDKNEVTRWVFNYFFVGKGEESITGTYPSHTGGHYQTYTYDFELDKEELIKWYENNKDAIIKNHKKEDQTWYKNINFNKYGKVISDRWGQTDKKVIEYEWHDIDIAKTDKGIFMRLCFSKIGGTGDEVIFTYEETNDVLYNKKEIELDICNFKSRIFFASDIIRQKITGLQFESEDCFSYPDSQDYKIEYLTEDRDYKEIYFRQIGEQK